MKQGITGRRLRAVVATGAALVALVAMTASAQAATSVTVSGAGPGSTVIATGDSNPNKYWVSWVYEGGPGKIKIKDLNGGAVNTSQYCSRVYYAGVAVQSAVQCSPVKGSSGIQRVQLDYAGGNDVGYNNNPAGLPQVTQYGGTGNDQLFAPPSGGSLMGGCAPPASPNCGSGDGNDSLIGGAGTDIMLDQDPYSTDVAVPGAGDLVLFNDATGGDVAWCGVSTKLALLGLDPGDVNISNNCKL